MSDKATTYEKVTDQIISQLKEGVVPWRRPWSTAAFRPKNWDGRPYSGINWLLLSMQPYEQNTYLTYRKAAELGGHVKEGEKGHMVCFWKFMDSKTPDPKTGKKKIIPMLRHFTVFNVSQCEGLPERPEERPGIDFQPIAECERVIANMPNPPECYHDGAGRCYYRSSDDTIHMTIKQAFTSEEEYYATRFHEEAHGTGHDSRLGRRNEDGPRVFGDPVYSREELVAELASAFLCAECGINSPNLANTASYIENWMEFMKDDPQAIVYASGRAAKAADYILGKVPPRVEEPTAGIAKAIEEEPALPSPTAFPSPSSNPTVSPALR